MSELTGHLVLVHRGLAAALGRPSAERPLPADEYVRQYAPNADVLNAATLEVAAEATGLQLVDRLDEAIDLAAAALARPLPAVLRGGRGPISAEDLIDTRIIELVVHSDDLSRSLPEREPVPLQRSARVPMLCAASPRSWPTGIPAAPSRSACPRTRRCSAASATRDPPTPAAPRRTWSRPTRSPSSG